MGALACVLAALLAFAAPASAAPVATSRDTVAPDLLPLDGVDTASASEAEGEGDEPDDEVETATVAATTTSTGPRYTSDLTDAALAVAWRSARAELGSISMGANDFGRVVNGVAFPADPRWVVVDPPNTWGTRETVDYLVDVLAQMHALYPDAPPMRVNHISTPHGGYLRPHRSHQLGRDVDLGLYYSPSDNPRARAIDMEKNWALLRLLITRTDVEVVLLDRRIIRAMHAHAVSVGEDRAWVDQVFGLRGRGLVQHARGHRDHFHVRFYNARAQELGWRIQPLLTKDETVPQVMRHRIRSGENLGSIARRYGVTITAIKKLNRMRSNFLRAGHSLAIPVRGMACERCPTMARVVVPPRLLPPEPLLAASVGEAAAPVAAALAPTAAPTEPTEPAAPTEPTEPTQPEPARAADPAEAAVPERAPPVDRPATGDAPRGSTRRGLVPPEA